jgi:hypoxanthine phosphoribosyltransferase
MRCPAGTGDDYPHAPAMGPFGETGNQVGRTVCRQGMYFKRYFEFIEELRGLLHNGQVGGASHDDADQWIHSFRIIDYLRKVGKTAYSANMETHKVLDKTFVSFIPHIRIQETIARMAADLDRDLSGKDPLFLAVLNGSFVFAADLFKQIKMPARISFVKMASYIGTGSSGKVDQLIGLQEVITGQHIVILEDIIDSGLTLTKLLEHLKGLQPASVRIASLLFKPDAFRADFKIDYLGMEIPNNFVVGYGLDYNGYGRNSKDIYTLL